MKTKIERATEIHRTMAPHQMALRIVELQDALELADEAVRAGSCLSARLEKLRVLLAEARDSVAVRCSEFGSEEEEALQDLLARVDAALAARVPK